MFKKISVLALLCVSQLGFSQSEATTSTTKKAKAKPFFDAILPYVSISQRDTVFRSADSSSDAASSTTLVDMGANIIKGKWRFYGAYYLLREEGFVPEVNDFLRPEVHAYYTLFNVNNWTTTLSGGYFPEHNGQDEFGQLAGELVYFKTFTSKAGALSLRWDNDVTTHLNHEKVYESPDKTIKRTADTPAYLLATSLEASFVPAKVKGLHIICRRFCRENV